MSDIGRRVPEQVLPGNCKYASHLWFQRWSLDCDLLSRQELASCRPEILLEFGAIFNKSVKSGHYTVVKQREMSLELF